MMKVESYLLKPAVLSNVNSEVNECTVRAIGLGSKAIGRMHSHWSRL